MLNQENTMETNDFENRLNLEPIKVKVDALKGALGGVVIGQDALIHQLLIALLGRGHVLIEGVPGIAKTLVAKSLAKSIHADFSRIQFTPDLMPSDVLGTSIFNQKTQDFELKKGPIYSNLVLIDEINRAPAKTQAALFEVMEEYQITVDGTSIPLEEPFMVLATQNPIEHEGTYRLPEAQLDRFMMKILVDYPDEVHELAILKKHQQAAGIDPLSQLKPLLSSKELLEIRDIIRQVEVSEGVLNYINQIIRASRNFNGLYLGVSPRGGVSLLNAAKACAVIDGRDFVSPEDVKFCALPVLRHRVTLSPEKEMEGIRTDEILVQLINQIEIPR
ncbi:MAG: MoxR family ATPase [Bacteroidota bacterium]|nr:MoxR family ATPase [Bacteroidota bacterium]MDX5430642.1 MoxR family ATPase [Bacteroidota bacterium]MDX5469392.1 MoxR family ATPase [Bacteroidota bacterium]